MLNKNRYLTHYRNPKANKNAPYTDAMRSILSASKAREAMADMRHWPGYSATPLHELAGLADQIEVGKLFYKDESTRFELKSFKSLGGSYAVAMQLLLAIRLETGKQAKVEDLFSGKYAEVIRQVTVATATDGNHGRSVAWGARMFGCACVIYIHADVSVGRERSMAELGAEVIRIAGNYDDSVKEADQAAKENGWIIVSDNSYEGYMEIPKSVALGYSVMLQEAVDQLDGHIPSHVFIQGGCGGLASAVCGFFWDLWGDQRPRLIVVEPEQANCLQLSAVEEKLVIVDGKLETLMAGLACGEVSLLAWKILETGADDFTTVAEALVPESMRLLARGCGDDPSIEAGESAVAGIAALLGIQGDEAMRKLMGVDNNSSILIIGTEGATDPELYQQILHGER
ncbi:diaminopropionate ammonia-lyase [Marinobacterium mangrovicola]|uniref:Diaminopropionate ammonia-lyase n=1 Tax=Marinobacterium mangrovicola TaxID=1476959 RepID=A0A4V2PCX9_9GAMM|nr:diaminopropionate ammonia-lyase [Marinobacterium mangrovicola]TCK02966.1 diaminopropionate ammonia-lyase [Marinobacterium mangrovicola]